jgi:putative ABC transport system permease protein
MGNVISLITGSTFVVPWLWMALGVVISFTVGLTSGYLPAVQASKLDPIEALRYE